MKIVISKEVIKKLKKSDKLVKAKFIQCFERLKIWFPFEKQWNVHKLKWKYWNYWSMNITWDIRLIFRITDDKIYLEKIWTYSELY